jgi:hypothetical protein
MVAAEQPGHLGAERRGDLRRLGQQEVAGEDGRRLPQRALTLSTVRRVVASSMTSSW